MGSLIKILIVSLSLISFSSVSKAEVTYSCWNCMMLGIDGEGNLEGARVDYNAKGGPDLAVTNYPYGDYLQALQLNMQLIKNEKVCCWEIAEINPKFDKNNKGTSSIFKILEQVTKMLIKNY